jgi:hypothetical protein
MKTSVKSSTTFFSANEKTTKKYKNLCRKKKHYLPLSGVEGEFKFKHVGFQVKCVSDAWSTLYFTCGHQCWRRLEKISRQPGRIQFLQLRY